MIKSNVLLYVHCLLHLIYFLFSSKYLNASLGVKEEMFLMTSNMASGE